MDLMSVISAQGIYSGQVERRLLDCWNWMICFKDAVYSLAFQVTRQYELIEKKLALHLQFYKLVKLVDLTPW